MAGADQGAEDCFWIRYKFTLPQNRIREFRVRLRPDTLALISDARESYPEWTRLSHEQCANCPLQPEVHEYCPVAVNLVEVVEYFKDVWSYEQVEVEITTLNRTFTKQTPLQDALSSLAGIYMVTSGCPILDKLRPLVYTHMPFGGLEETMYRAVAMYCLAQFFRKQRGKDPDWELTGLAKIYEDVAVVNKSFHRRLLEVGTKEAGRNALIRLDSYAQYTNGLLFQKGLGKIERFFEPYLNE
jgi:hypothetical protein